MPVYHVAQVNIGRVKAPVEDPLMAGFVARLDEINALAIALRASSGGCKRPWAMRPIFVLIPKTTGF